MEGYPAEPAKSPNRGAVGSELLALLDRAAQQLADQPDPTNTAWHCLPATPTAEEPGGQTRLVFLEPWLFDCLIVFVFLSLSTCLFASFLLCFALLCFALLCFALLALLFWSRGAEPETVLLLVTFSSVRGGAICTRGFVFGRRAGNVPSSVLKRHQILD